MNEEDKPIECRAAVAIEAAAANELTFLPAGLHEIRPVSGGIGKAIKVLVDARTAAEIERQRQEIQARTGKRPYFDFNHEDGAASFWPASFIWGASGVVAKGEWSASGKKAIEGKDFRAFSPVFHVDNKRADPAKVVCCVDAGPNMGGLVNDPAFSNLSVWAKNDGSPVKPLERPANNDKQKEETMTAEELAALRAKHQELETKVEQLTAIVAQNTEDEPAKMRLTTAEAEAKAAALEIETAELKAKGVQLAETIQKRNRADAEAFVREAVLDGRIAAKDLVSQERWRIQIAADPVTFGQLLRSVPSMKPAGRLTFPSVPGFSPVSVVNEDPLAVYAKMHRVVTAQARAGSREEKMRLGSEFSALYAGSFAQTDKNREQRVRLIGTQLSIIEDAIKAADVTDANLGTIAGTLVTQRTLELLKFKFPALVRFTTDFSDQPATFNQTVMTRIVGIPPVQTYSTATGWADSTATTTDVPVVINNHKGVPITFGENLLASTMRRLFDEFAEAMAYALAKNLVDALYVNLTDANFTNNTVSTSANFLRTTVVDIGTALELRGVPLGLGVRTMLLWPNAFASLKKDPTLTTLASYQPFATPIITEGTQPEATLNITVDSFQVYSAPNMPSNNANLVGFAGSKSALCIVTRTPNDYTSILPGASFGNVQMVTDPDIGITVMQVQYVNHVLGTATSRIALMYGTAPGQTNAGQLIKAAAGSGSSR